MNDRNAIIDLLHLKLANLISKEDDDYIERLLLEDEEVRHIWQTLQQSTVVDEHFNKAQPIMWKNIRQGVSKRRLKRVIRRGVISAVTISIISLAVWWLVNKNRSNIPLTPDAVTLKLGDGEIIDLSQFNSKHIKADNTIFEAGKDTLRIVSAKANDNISWNTLTVPIGKIYTIILPDSSTANLNATTKLRFPSAFSEHSREVYLDGEAYFNIKKNTNKSFKVHIPDGTIEVLGTKFNVSTYDSVTAKVALVEGSVQFKTEEKDIQLKPGQEAVYTKGHGILIQSFDQEEVLSWIQGIYYYNDETLENISKVLERYYKVTVIIDDSSLAKEKFVGSLNKNWSINTFLISLRKTGKSRFYIQGDTIHLTH